MKKSSIFIALSFTIFISCLSVKPNEYISQGDKISPTNPLVGIWKNNVSSKLARNIYFGDDFSCFWFFDIDESPDQIDIKNNANAPEEFVQAIPSFMIAEAKENPIIINGTYSYSGNKITVIAPRMAEGIWQKDGDTETWNYYLYPNGDLYLQIGNEKVSFKKSNTKLSFVIEKIVDENQLIDMTIEQVEQYFNQKLRDMGNGYYKMPLYFPDFAIETQLYFENDKVSRCVYFFRGSQQILDNKRNKLNNIYGTFSIENNEYIFRNNLPKNIQSIVLGLDNKNNIGIIYIGVNSSLKI